MIPIVWNKSLFLLFVALATLAAFEGVRRHEFVLLDDDALIEKSSVSQSFSSHSLRQWFTRPTQGLFIPITYVFWNLEAGLSAWTPSPRIFHTASWLLHGANALWVYACLSLILGAGWAAACGALVFSLHPMQAEAVSWASATKDLLSGFLALASLYVYLRSSSQPLFRALGVGLFGLALLAKPSAVCVIGIAFLVAVGIQLRPWKGEATRLLPHLLLALPILAITKLSQLDPGSTTGIAAWMRAVLLGDALTFYLSKLVLPLGLTPDYGYTPLWRISLPATYGVCLFPLLLGGILKLKAPRFLLPLGIFIVGMLPVSGVISFYHQTFSTVADRYAYLSMFGAALAIALWLSRAKSMKRFAIVAILLCIYALSSMQQLRHWQSSDALFRRMLDINPNSALAHNNLATLFERRGRLDEALRHYTRSTEILPEALPPHFNAGRVALMLGKDDEAERHLEIVIAKDPSVKDAHYSLGLLWRKRHDEKRANAHFHLAGRHPDRG